MHKDVEDKVKVETVYLDIYFLWHLDENDVKIGIYYIHMPLIRKSPVQIKIDYIYMPLGKVLVSRFDFPYTTTFI